MMVDLKNNVSVLLFFYKFLIFFFFRALYYTAHVAQVSYRLCVHKQGCRQAFRKLALWKRGSGHG